MLAAAASADAMMGAVLLFVFGIARGIPIIAIGAAADLLPRMLPASLWMRRIERAAGVVLLVASAAFGYQAGVYAGWVPPVPI
jgi:cytochrome c-type biogenesis protein